MVSPDVEHYPSSMAISLQRKDYSVNAFTFDLETENLAAEIGGWDAPPADFGITTCVGWSAASGRPHIYRNSREELSRLVGMLEAHDCIISFNGVNFDLPIIEGVYGEKVAVKHHVDLLQLIWDASKTGGHRGGYKLTECCERALGITKSGESIMAPELARQGRWDDLISYCLNDVIITRKLAIFAQENGGIISPEGDLLKLDFPPWFRDLTI